MTELDYALAMARHHGLPARRLAPAEIAAGSPLIDTRGLVGGALFEGDATVNPGLAAFATAKAALDAGRALRRGLPRDRLSAARPARHRRRDRARD